MRHVKGERVTRRGRMASGRGEMPARLCSAPGRARWSWLGGAGPPLASSSFLGSCMEAGRRVWEWALVGELAAVLGLDRERWSGLLACWAWAVRAVRVAWTEPVVGGLPRGAGKKRARGGFYSVSG